MVCPNCKAETEIILFTDKGSYCRSCKGVVEFRVLLPEWFGKALAVAQHRDAIASWPLLARIGHKLLVSWRCPCCIEWKKQRSKKMKVI